MNDSKPRKYIHISHYKRFWFRTFQFIPHSSSRIPTRTKARHSETKLVDANILKLELLLAIEQKEEHLALAQQYD